MQISLRDLLLAFAAFWLLIAATACLAWYAGQSQVAAIQVQPGGSTVMVHPASVVVEGAKIQTPVAAAPVINVTAPAPSVTVLPADPAKIDVHAVVKVDTVQALRTTLGPLPVEKPDEDEHGKLLRSPK